MKSSAVSPPTEKSVVLVGAGNAHLVFLKRWGMRPLPGVAVTLVNEAAVDPLLGDGARPHRRRLLLGRDHHRPGAPVPVGQGALRGRARARASTRRRGASCFADRPPLAYDVAVARRRLARRPVPPATAGADSSLVMRPLGDLLRRARPRWSSDCSARRGRFTWSSSAAAPAAASWPWPSTSASAGIAGFRLTLLQGNAAAAAAVPGARRAGLRGGVRGSAASPSASTPASTGGDGRIARCWTAASGSPSMPSCGRRRRRRRALLRDSGLAVDAGGFLRVARHAAVGRRPRRLRHRRLRRLRVATPTCRRTASTPSAQGRVLFDNVAAFLRERPLRPFRPQRFCLCLLNTADGAGRAQLRPAALEGPLGAAAQGPHRPGLDRQVHRASRRWRTAAAEARTPQMRCGGCGSKISSDVLSAVLKRLDIPDDPRVLLGCRAGEDAAVHRVRPELFGAEPDKLVEVQTVDYFKAFVDDPVPVRPHRRPERRQRPVRHERPALLGPGHRHAALRPRPGSGGAAVRAAVRAPSNRCASSAWS